MKARGKRLLLIILTTLVVLRLLAPVVAEIYVNEQLLADLGDYRGHVDDVDFALWRTAIRLEGLRIEKTVGHPRVDFIIVPAIDIRLRPTALLRQIIRLNLTIEEPEINFVDAEEAVNQQAGAGLVVAEEPAREPRFKLEIALLEVRNGTIAFRNFTSQPPMNLQATNLNLVAENLTTAESVSSQGSELPGKAELSADLLESSRLEAEAEFDPVDYRRFKFAGEAFIDNLVSLNPFFKAYANLDLESGHGTVVVELRAQEGRLSGYAKPVIENVEFVDMGKKQGPLELLWEGVAGAAAAILSHPSTGKIATRIEFSGDVPETMNLDGWGAIFSMLRNAFIEAMDTGFDPITTLGNDVEADEAQELDDGDKKGGTTGEQEE